WTEGSEAELLVVADPAWETLPETLPARVLLVSDESTVMAGWAEQLAQRGYFRDFGWRSKGRAQQSALFCTSQPTQLKMVRGYEMEMDILRDRMVRAERTSGEEAELIARLRSDLSLSRSHEQQLEKALGEVTGSKFWKMTWPMRYVVSKSRQLWHTLPPRPANCAGADEALEEPVPAASISGRGHARGPLRLAELLVHQAEDRPQMRSTWVPNTRWTFEGAGVN
ncbi:MAG: glycosyltransferase family 2 protein, partial [Faecalibacterium prausnitzii]